MGMKTLEIGIDLDGTLLDNTDQEGRRCNLPVLNSIYFFAKQCKNVRLSLYSARPIEQQLEIVNRLGIGRYISGHHVKSDGWKPDIHIDDQQEVELGDKNIIVRMK